VGFLLLVFRRPSDSTSSPSPRSAPSIGSSQMSADGFGSDGFDRRRSFLHEIGVLSIAWLLKLLSWLCRGVRTERRFWFVIAGREREREREREKRERESEARETIAVGERTSFFLI
jgi:hypothetical protein